MILSTPHGTVSVRILRSILINYGIDYTVYYVKWYCVRVHFRQSEYCVLLIFVRNVILCTYFNCQFWINQNENQKRKDVTVQNSVLAFR